MFVGTYEHRIDTKGRLVLPSRFRQDLGDCVVVSMGMGPMFLFTHRWNGSTF